MPEPEGQRLLSPMTRSSRSSATKQWRPDDAHLRAAWGVFLLAFGLSVVWLLTHGSSGTSHLVDGIFLLLCSLMAAFSMTRRLPVQNVIAVSLIILGISAIAIATVAYYGTDTGRKIGFNQEFGPPLLGSSQKNLLPWQMPFLVLALTLTSRETARLILRPWRREKNYGLWLMLLGAALVSLTCLALEPFANRANWWRWLAQDSEGSLPKLHSGAWFGTPWTAFACWFVFAIVIYWFAGPWFVVKRPHSTIPELTPICLWCLLLAYFIVGNIKAGLTIPAVVSAGAGGVVAFMAWRGWKLSQPPAPPAPVPALSNGAA